MPDVGVFETPRRALEGDPGRDGDVRDVTLVADLWRMARADPSWKDRYELDGDEEISVLDMMLVAVRWGESCP